MISPVAQITRVLALHAHPLNAASYLNAPAPSHIPSQHVGLARALQALLEQALLAWMEALAAVGAKDGR